MARAAETAPRSARLVPAVFVPALLGLAISIYLTIEHFSSSASLACPESAKINCQKVTTSSYSHLLGVPVALAGLIYFVVMAVLQSPSAWREPRLDLVRVVGVVAGVLMVLYLLWAELFKVDAICLWCTAVHLCTLWMFAGTIWHASGQRAAY